VRLTHSQGSQVGLKANAPALAIPALGDRRARVRPKLRAKAARQGPRTSRPEMALSVPSPHPPAPAPFGARECENVEIGARSQVGLIRHADQEIRVRPGPDRSSPYWVTRQRGGQEAKNPRRQGCRCRSRLSTHRWQSGCSSSTLPLEITYRRLGRTVRGVSLRVWRRNCRGMPTWAPAPCGGAIGCPPQGWAAGS
jgi:hypothetical protein